MNIEAKKSYNIRDIFKFISTVISWTIFVLLLICAAFLVYYFIATRIYVAKGSGYEPKFSLYTIISPSMTPNINVYDVIIDVKVDKPEDIKINDVITFNSSLPEVHGGTITHRVIAISKDKDGNYYYQTKGDSNLVEDSAKVSFDSVVGKVALRIPKLGKVQRLLATSAGWLLLIALPALYIIVKMIIRVLKLKDVDSNSGKFKKFLNRPVIGYNKPKLLTYTPHNESVMPSYTNDEEIDIDDLPSLK